MAALLDRILCALGSRELPEPVHATLVPEKEGQPEPAAKLIPEPAKSVEETKEAPEARPEPEEAPGSPNESFAETEAVPEEAAEAPVAAAPEEPEKHKRSNAGTIEARGGGLSATPARVGGRRLQLRLEPRGVLALRRVLRGRAILERLVEVAPQGLGRERRPDGRPRGERACARRDGRARFPRKGRGRTRRARRARCGAAPRPGPRARP